MESIYIAWEFVDMFHLDLSRVPLDGNIDFSIGVELGTKLISILPYYMAPTELKELKKQLQDLLSKGFISPSVSPWVPLFCS